jgi:hypothetical protein
MQGDVALEAFKYAIDHETQLRVQAGPPVAPAGLAAGAAAIPGKVELSSPSRLGPAWRGSFAAVLLAAIVVIALARFFELPFARGIQPPKDFFITAMIALPVTFLMLVIGWGKVTVTWAPEEEESEDGAEAPPS